MRRKSLGFGLCLLLVLPAWAQRARGFGGGFGGGGIGFGAGAVRSGFGRSSAVVGFGPFGAFGRIRSPGSAVIGFGTPQNFANLGIPPIGSALPSLGVNAPGSAFFSGLLADSFFPGWSMPWYPFTYGGYDIAPQQPSPSVIVIQPFSPEMMAPRKPPEPARLEIREYKGPAPEEAQPAAGAPRAAQMFTIALRSGARDSAMAAWVENDCLSYLNERGRRQTVSLTAIDRDATERLNREKNLSLWLPPE